MDNCAGCKHHCCGALAGVRPILMPWEDGSAYRTTTKGPLTLLEQNADGLCVYFDPQRWAENTGGCTIYDRRPFECRVFPLIVDFSGAVPLLKRDLRATCSVNGTILPIPTKTSAWPADWIAKYRVADVTG